MSRVALFWIISLTVFAAPCHGQETFYLECKDDFDQVYARGRIPPVKTTPRPKTSRQTFNNNNAIGRSPPKTTTTTTSRPNYTEDKTYAYGLMISNKRVLSGGLELCLFCKDRRSANCHPIDKQFTDNFYGISYPMKV